MLAPEITLEHGGVAGFKVHRREIYGIKNLELNGNRTIQW
jgi:hypothetical protein